ASIVAMVERLSDWTVWGAVISPGASCRRHKPARVLGFDADLPRLAAQADGVLIAVGQIEDPMPRMRLFERLCALNAHLPTLVADNASVASTASLGRGTVVMQQALVNAFARVGDDCIVNSQALIEHDVEVGDHCHISTGARINGDAHIGNRCFIGSGAVIGQGVRICDDTVIGAGSVVIRDIKEPGVWVGNPARRVK
ncbi:acetyltransferase, partial [Sulfurivirga sp.]|uniref:acetyltransferase n=1 Tax=Sulfurivirga sp. TaxID=2614236 RepID=UPI0025DBE54F